MVDGTFAPDTAGRPARFVQQFGTIIVVGGGCYGSYYVRQLLRASIAGALSWKSLVVVDRDSGCAVAGLDGSARPPHMELVVDEWAAYFGDYLQRAAAEPEAHAADAIVPSPLMPHLMADWLVDRARRRWAGRRIDVVPLDRTPAVRWQRAGDDGTHYVSFADWMCPINCIEPARCPHTRSARDWSLPTAIAAYAQAETDAGHPIAGTFVFHCAHRAYGVGMLDVRDIVLADLRISELGASGAATFLLGTASHCHGALRRVDLAA